MSTSRQAIRDHVNPGGDPAEIDGLDELAFLLGVQPDDLYSNDGERWTALNEQTRQAVVQIAAMQRERPVDVPLMLDIARHIAPDDPVAVLCVFGQYPADTRHQWTAEQKRALHVRAATHLATMS